ncbi:metallopeptidase family protein [uncultured Amnibacterium sp.]|uniref:metallopeptidase family protein n=1 Tax=uncultured Amnibacterium sp. TaxID=1631851 RepID=UPI0035CBC5E2
MTDANDGERLDAATFERLVVEELDRLPDEMVDGLENVAFVTDDEAEDGEYLLGRYDGVDLTRRERYGFGELPDRIVLYRLPLLAATADEAELRAEVRTTLIHEIGHYFGLDDDRLHELGWA